MSVFVTVGSTSFDNLIETLCSNKCLDLLESLGYKQITFQIGRGNVIPPESSKLEIKWFRFKDSLSDDIKNASLVIGHAGAGTILESLFENKLLIVVLNENLMHNHQGELAEKLASEGYLKYSSCSDLEKTLQDSVSCDFVKSSFIPQPDGFNEILEALVGLK